MHKYLKSLSKTPKHVIWTQGRKTKIRAKQHETSIEINKSVRWLEQPNSKIEPHHETLIQA